MPCVDRTNRSLMAATNDILGCQRPLSSGKVLHPPPPCRPWLSPFSTPYFQPSLYWLFVNFICGSAAVYDPKRNH